VGFVARAGRFQWRVRCGRRGQCRFRRARYRYRRIDPATGRAFRRRRNETDLWSGLAIWRDRVRFVARSSRTAYQNGARRRHDYESDRGPRSERQHVSERAGAGLYRFARPGLEGNSIRFAEGIHDRGNRSAGEERGRYGRRAFAIAWRGGCRC
jgi:hypothetical protein